MNAEKEELKNEYHRRRGILVEQLRSARRDPRAHLWTKKEASARRLTVVAALRELEATVARIMDRAPEMAKTAVDERDSFRMSVGQLPSDLRALRLAHEKRLKKAKKPAEFKNSSSDVDFEVDGMVMVMPSRNGPPNAQGEPTASTSTATSSASTEPPIKTVQSKSSTGATSSAPPEQAANVTIGSSQPGPVENRLPTPAQSVLQLVGQQLPIQAEAAAIQQPTICQQVDPNTLAIIPASQASSWEPVAQQNGPQSAEILYTASEPLPFTAAEQQPVSSAQVQRVVTPYTIRNTGAVPKRPQGQPHFVQADHANDSPQLVRNPFAVNYGASTSAGAGRDAVKINKNKNKNKNDKRRDQTRSISWPKKLSPTKLKRALKQAHDRGCFICPGRHGLIRCPCFCGITNIAVRRAIVDALNLCRNCFLDSHREDQCRDNRHRPAQGCRACGGARHNSLVCLKQTGRQ